MFRFAEPNMLFLLLVIPLLSLLYYISYRWRIKRLRRFGDMELIKQLMPEASPRRDFTKFMLLLCSVLFLVIALARPQTGAKLREVTRSGYEIIFAVDVSNSMLASDFEPNRLERTKIAMNQIISEMPDNNIGIIVFAGDAYVQLPVTSDHTIARNFISSISPTLVSKQGTAIGTAIDLASNSFSSQSEGSRVLIMISDGENHEDDPLSSAETAKERGIVIHTIGIGSAEGAAIPVGDDFIRDEEGNIVVSKLDEGMLQQIALSTGGLYVRASTSNMGLKEIVDRINETEGRVFTARVFDEYNEQYHYPLIIALMLLVVQFLMLDRKNRLLSKYNIFRKEE